jgi:hypothetical protein
MTGKYVRPIMAALLALVMTFNTTAVFVPTATGVVNSTTTRAMEIGITKC